jgi:hypothetical protein
MEIRDLRAVDAETIEKYRGRLFLAGLSLDTRVWRGSVLRGFFGWLTRRGHIPRDPMKDVPPLRRRFMEKIPVLTKEEIARLTFRCPAAPDLVKGRREPLRFFQRRLELGLLAEFRDTALLALIYDVPLRGGEPSAVRDFVRAGVPESVAMSITGHRTRAVFDRYDIASQRDKRAALLATEADREGQSPSNVTSIARES